VLGDRWFMMIRLTLCLSVVALASCSVVSKEAGEGRTKVDSPSEWVAMSKPGESHRLMDSFVGTWNVAMTFWGSPQSAPERSSGVSESKWILGGRFIQESFKGTVGGQNFEGIGLFGFDNGRRRFETLWLDSLNTSVARSTGTFDPENQIYSFEGEVYDPLVGRDKSTKTTIRFLSPDRYLLTMFDHNPVYGDYKSLEIEYVRKHTQRER
jgi:Protein of unknown function (DUF1579)